MRIFLFLLITVISRASIVSSIDTQSIGLANDEFNLAILKDLYTKDPKAIQSNLVYSSFSLSQALSMLLLGARGSSYKEIARTLHYTPLLYSYTAGQSSIKKDALFSSISELNKNLIALQNITLEIANGGYPSDKFALNPDYVSQVSKYFNAAWKSLDYAKSIQAADTINTDIAKATKGTIKELIPASALSPATILVLTNAIYYKGNWKTAFDPKKSTDLPFNCDDGTVQSVKMMQDTRKAHYNSLIITGIEVKALELGYANDDIVMLYVLPVKKSLKLLISKMSQNNLDKIRIGLKLLKTEISLPLINTSTALNLVPTLARLGMSDLFGDKADLSGITSNSNLKLAISDIFHKATITVNEEGTVAAAATGIVVGLTSVLERITFKADKPFLYFLLDKKSGTILFTGTFVKK